jgi:hypothetical protein
MTDLEIHVSAIMKYQCKLYKLTSIAFPVVANLTSIAFPVLANQIARYNISK